MFDEVEGHEKKEEVVVVEEEREYEEIINILVYDRSHILD